MIEFFLLISMYSNAGAVGQAVSVTALPAPFYSQEECKSAGDTAKRDLIEGMTMVKSVSYVCVKRTAPAPKPTPSG